jgi:aspartate aminotransferase
MKAPSNTIQSLERSGIRELFDLANRIPDAIHLEIGEPNFPTPAHVVEAAAQAARDGHTKYTPNAGVPELREALAQKVKSRNRLDAETEQMVVTPGAIAALYGTMMAVCDPGDQILIPDPGWPNYNMIARLQGLEVVRYPLREEDGLAPSAEVIEPLITDRTRVLLLNSPSNPTGVVSGAESLRGVMNLASARDLWVVSDEVYDEMAFDSVVAPSAASHGDPDRIVTIWSFSKTYAMTGWRVGYALAPAHLAPYLIKIQEPVTACVNAPAQVAALAAVAGPQACVEEMRSAYRSRRDAITGILDSAGVPYHKPHGAFYTWVDISLSGLPSREFARRLLVESHVAVTPGEAFGPAGTDHVRVSLAAESGQLYEGVRRLCQAVDAWSSYGGYRSRRLPSAASAESSSDLESAT